MIIPTPTRAFLLEALKYLLPPRDVRDVPDNVTLGFDALCEWCHETPEALRRLLDRKVIVRDAMGLFPAKRSVEAYLAKLIEIGAERDAERRRALDRYWFRR
jgi:hypothetical protein